MRGRPSLTPSEHPEGVSNIRRETFKAAPRSSGWFTSENEQDQPTQKQQSNVMEEVSDEKAKTISTESWQNLKIATGYWHNETFGSSGDGRTACAAERWQWTET